MRAARVLAGTAVVDFVSEQKKPEAVAARVVELLPNAAYRLELDNRSQVIAHPAGAASANFVRLRPQDKVLVELSPHDPTRGRIVRLLNKE